MEREQAKKECHEQAMAKFRVGNEDLTPVIQAARFGFECGFDAGHAAADDWVAIEDGMPDDHDWYLVAADYDGGIQGLTEINYFGGEFNERVIAWQPLPKPYQRPNDEEKNK